MPKPATVQRDRCGVGYDVDYDASRRVVGSSSNAKVTKGPREGWRPTLGLGINSVTGLALIALSGIILAVYEIVHLAGYSYPSGPTNSIFAISPFDEGVYTETGILIAHGYQLYGQIYSAQPPLLPLALSLVERLPGSGLADARWMVLGFGLLAVMGVAAVAGASKGWIAAGAAAILLVLSPEFLVYGHAIEEEIPMTALCLVSLALAMGWSRRKESELVAVSGFFFGLAVLTKFLAFSLLAPLAIMVAIAAWEDRDRLWSLARDVLLFAVAALVPFGLSLAVWGHAEWNQMVNDRLGATADQAQLQSLSSLHLLRNFLSVDPGLAALAGLAAVALIARDWKVGLILDSWLGATLLILLRYHPLFGHHLAVLLGPMAVVSGAGVACLLPQSGEKQGFGFNPGGRAEPDGAQGHAPANGLHGLIGVGAFLAGAGIVAYLALVPFQISAYGQLLVSTSPADRELALVSTTVAQYATRTGKVVAADPVICVQARRLCVPQTVDTSYVRVETGKLKDIITYTKDAGVQAVVLGRALCLDPYMASYDRWVHAHFRLILPATIDLPSGQCPWRSDNTIVRPHWQPGVYVLGARGLTP